MVRTRLAGESGVGLPELAIVVKVSLYCCPATAVKVVQRVMVYGVAPPTGPSHHCHHLPSAPRLPAHPPLFVPLVVVVHSGDDHGGRGCTHGLAAKTGAGAAIEITGTAQAAPAATRRRLTVRSVAATVESLLAAAAFECLEGREMVMSGPNRPDFGVRAMALRYG
jgi:hypothetical protein